MHSWRKLPLILIVFLINVSCSNPRSNTPISIDKFEEGISTNTIEKMILHSDNVVEIKYVDKEQIYQVTSDTLLPKVLRKYIFEILHKYDSSDIIFEEHVRFIDNFF